MQKKLTKGQYLDALLRSPKTVFSIKDVALLWGEESENTTRVRLKSYSKKGKLVRVRRGFYAKDNNYNRLELATRIYTPSYISFETVLTQAGINFQYYSNTFVASYVTREIEANGQKITYVRMKDFVLSNPVGIEHTNGVAIATKERAFLDRIYVSKDYHFDNLRGLDWDKVFEILPIYRNKRMEKKVKIYFEDFKLSQINFLEIEKSIEELLFQISLAQNCISLLHGDFSQKKVFKDFSIDLPTIQHALFVSATIHLYNVLEDSSKYFSFKKLECDLDIFEWLDNAQTFKTKYSYVFEKYKTKVDKINRARGNFVAHRRVKRDTLSFSISDLTDLQTSNLLNDLRVILGGLRVDVWNKKINFKHGRK